MAEPIRATGWSTGAGIAKGDVVTIGGLRPKRRPVAEPPTPCLMRLPLGGTAQVFTREQLTQLYACSHGELGRLMVRKLAPLPIRVDDLIVWHADEVYKAGEKVAKVLEKWRH